METTEIYQQALNLDAAKRAELIDLLQTSLDQPNAEIDRIWIEEAERRLSAYRAGDLKAIPAEEVFRNL